MVDKLFDVYRFYPSAKAIQDALEEAHQVSNVAGKKFATAKYAEFFMIKDKLVTEQINDFEFIANDLRARGVNLDESFHLGILLEKLPPSWFDFY